MRSALVCSTCGVAMPVTGRSCWAWKARTAASVRALKKRVNGPL